MDKASLMTALKLSKPALGASALIDGLDCFFFSGNKVTAFNGSLAIVADMGFEFPTTGWIAGEAFHKLLKELSSDISLAVSAAGESKTLLIKSGGTRATFPALALNGSLFTEPDFQSKEMVLPKSAMFLNGIKKCMVSISTKSLSSEEAGIHMFLDGTNCELFATNGTTISRYGFSATDAGEDLAHLPVKASLLIPAAFCEQLTYLFTELLACPDEVAVGADEQKYLWARFPKVGLYCSFYSATAEAKVKVAFDSYAMDTPMVPIPKGFAEALKRTEIAGDKPLDIEYGPRLVMRASGTGVSEIVESLDSTYPTDGKLKVEVKHLQKVISSCAAFGFGDNFMMLEGADKAFSHIIAGKAE